MSGMPIRKVMALMDENRPLEEVKAAQAEATTRSVSLDGAHAGKDPADSEGRDGSRLFWTRR